jgi:hypothetical protein
VNTIGTGSASGTASASTASAPGAPTGLGGTQGVGLVGLSWTVPSSNGGSAITDYVVEYSSDSGTTWTTFSDGTSTTTSATVTGLGHSTTYTFRVSAVNTIGTGNASSTIDVDTAPAPFTDITARTLESGSAGVRPSIAIGNDGNPVISHRLQDAFYPELKIYVCSSADCSSGTSRTLLGTRGMGNTASSIAIGNDGNPIIAFDARSDGGMKIYFCSSADCASGTSTTLDSTDDVGYGYGFSLAVGNDGYPVVAYHADGAGGGLGLYACSATDCSTGTDRTLDSHGGTLGRFADVTIGDDGNPIISYYDSLNSSLKVYKCTQSDCSSGYPTTVKSLSGGTGFDTSIAVGSDGNPLVVYSEWLPGTVEVFACSSADCSSGSSSTIMETSSAADALTWHSIAFGPDGSPLIGYSDANASSKPTVYLCSATDCSTGSATSFDDEGWSYGLSLAIDDNGNPVITYMNEGLKFATATQG